MKKHLIALAALAAVGAVSAQTVTISGKLGFAYEAKKVAPAVGAATKTNGLQVTDGDFVLTAVEDLGQGLKMTASMAVSSKGRTTPITGRDASLTLSGGFGSVMIGAIDYYNGIIDLGGAGAPVYGLDGTVISGGDADVDMLSYTSPELMSGLTLKLGMFDGKTSAGAGAGTGGAEATATTEDGTVIGLNYSAGAFNLATDYTSYGKNAVAVAKDDRFRISASYDLGMAVIGAGFESRDTTAAANNTTKDTVIGIAVPMNALTFGATYARSKVEGAVRASKGYDLGVNYALSKRTSLALHYENVKDAALQKTTQYRVRMLHTF